MTLPDFVIIGAPRSGTTTINHHLATHPSVFMAPGKEVHFFDRHWERGIDWYESRFAAASPSQVVGEATPFYMSDPGAMERLCSTIPSGTLIAILRDPATRAHSHFHYLVARGLDRGTFEAALDREAAADPGAVPYLGMGRYAEHLERIESMAESSVHVLWTDDLHTEPNRVLEDLAAAIGVAPFEPTDRLRRVNAADRFRSIRARRVAKRLPPQVRKLVGRLNRVPTSYPPLRAATRARIIGELADDYDALERRTGRSLESWRAVASG